MCDASLSSIGEEIIVVQTLVNERNDLMKQHSCESSELKQFIPTAIVKPKYQKLSYDERQLPSSGATITETPRKIQKYLPSLPKSFSKRTYNIPNKNGASADRDMREDENADYGVTVNSIAIVPPLKHTTASILCINMDNEKYNNKNNASFAYGENTSNILITNAMNETNCEKKNSVKEPARRISGKLKIRYFDYENT